MPVPQGISHGLLPSDLAITTAMFSDSLDLSGAKEQVLREKLSPVQIGAYALGRARTARFVPTSEINPIHSYDAVIDFIDGSNPGDVIVISTGSSNVSAFWGELFSAAASSRGVVGMVTDGNFRDTSKIRKLGFAAFANSSCPIDFRGRMKLVETQQDVELGGVKVSPGDIICADDDGVVVIPQSLEAVVLIAARARATAESTVLAELLEGATLRQVWTKHGIL